MRSWWYQVGLDFYTTSPSFLESFLSVIRIGKLLECQFRKRKGIQKPKEVEQSTTFFPATNLGRRVFRPQFCRRLPVQESSTTAHIGILPGTLEPADHLLHAQRPQSTAKLFPVDLVPVTNDISLTLAFRERLYNLLTRPFCRRMRSQSLVGHEVKAIAFYGAHEDLEGPVTEGTVLMKFLARPTLRRHRRRLSFSLAHVSPAAPSALQSPACARPAASQAHRASVSAASP